MGFGQLTGLVLTSLCSTCRNALTGIDGFRTSQIEGQRDEVVIIGRNALTGIDGFRTNILDPYRRILLRKS